MFRLVDFTFPNRLHRIDSTIKHVNRHSSPNSFVTTYIWETLKASWGPQCLGNSFLLLENVDAWPYSRLRGTVGKKSVGLFSPVAPQRLFVAPAENSCPSDMVRNGKHCFDSSASIYPICSCCHCPNQKDCLGHKLLSWYFKKNGNRNRNSSKKP